MTLMTHTISQIKRVSFLTGALIVLSFLSHNVAAIARAVTASPQVAQTNQDGYQTYQSQRFKFKIDYPPSYRLDATEESRGIRLQPTTKDQTGSIVIAAFSNPNRLSALEWVSQQTAESNFSNRQDTPRSYSFAGQPAISYPWCDKVCADNVVFPSRDRQTIMVLTVLYDYPADQIRWDFQSIIGKFRFTS